MSPETAHDATAARDAAIVDALAVMISLLDNLEDIAAALNRIAGMVEGQASASARFARAQRPRRVAPPLPNRRDRT